MSEHRRKVLLVSASIGSGHNQAARAIKAAWESRFPGDSVVIADFMDERNSYINYLIKETYLKMIEVSPFLYDMLYRWTQGSKPQSKTQSLFSWFMKKTMLRLLSRFRPDVVVCTHPFPCAAMAYIKRRKQTAIPLAGAITDFAIHKTWIYPEVDAYLVADSLLQDELVRQGISADRIHVTGIPIHPSFGLKQQSTTEPALKSEVPMILIMGGGLGLGPIEDVLLRLDRLDLPLHIVAVAGKNAELEQDLRHVAKQSRHDVTVLGYTQDVRRLMRTASLLVTKPGALTISEGLAIGVPMLFCDPIPGQEVDNASFVIDNEAADWFGALPSEEIIALLFDTYQRKHILQQAKRLAHPQSAYAAVDIIDTLSTTPRRVVGM